MDDDERPMMGLGMHPAQVVDPKLAAGRGAEFSAGALEDVGPLDDSVPVHYYPEGEAAAAASTAVAIDASNKGFQMLQKMGWKGKGLGRKEDGLIEPVKAGVEAGVRLGLGKQQEDDKYTAADSVERRRLEVEIQADEDPDRKRRREAQAEREELIKQDVTQIMKTFYCQVCSKQYSTAMELEEHLSSYDHHHKKRLAEARAMELERTRDDRQRKEQRRQQREQQRLEEQIRKAQAAATKQQPAPAPPPQPPLPPAATAAGFGYGSSGSASGGWANPPLPPAETAPLPPPLPPPDDLPPAPQQQQVTAGVGMSFGLKVPAGATGAGRGGGRVAGRMPGGRLAGAPLAGLKRPAAGMSAAGAGGSGGLGFMQPGGLGLEKPAKVSAAFAESSSDEEGA
eukprot:GHRQ01003268.1.p1 GENE.GHRQ01003268.1~~GHRQ01003268.1.p1  ORF type:complete len:397 (+),score=163.19 GHRQ01003268.1:119-1309(+)